MKQNASLFRKYEFELRIYISFGIVIIIVLCSYLFFKNANVNFVIFGDWVGISPATSVRYGFLIVFIITILSSALRMWAGSILSSQRMMSFKVQHDELVKTGPYVVSRNPIYLADLIAFTGFALCLKPIGFLLPILLYLHYIQLIKYEEDTLEKEFAENYRIFLAGRPRLIPSFGSILRLRKILQSFNINYDGFRNNSLYLLLSVGFIVSSFTGNLIHAILIGLPGLIDWAIIHTVKGIDGYRVKKTINHLKA